MDSGFLSAPNEPPAGLEPCYCTRLRPTSSQEPPGAYGHMMQDLQGVMGSGMGWTMGLGSLLIIILLLLSVAALIKYVFFR